MWKKYQKNSKQTKQVKLAILALGLIILLLLISKIFSVFSSLSQPFNSTLNSSKKYSWDGNSSVNILIYSQKKIESLNPNDSKIALINLHPIEDKITILHIADEIFLELPKGYGSWKVGSIFDLGQEEKPARGSELLKLSVSKLVGLPIDGIIVLKNGGENEISIEDEIGNWRKNPLNRLTFLKTISTDLTPIELYKFITSSASVRSDNLSTLNLAQSNITKSELLKDSSRVLGVDTIKLDTFLRDNLQDPILSEEDLTVAIFNATSHPGLAQEASRIMTNLGINVIVLSNTEKLLEKSKVTVKDQIYKDKLTFKKSAQFFAPNCLNKDCPSGDPRVDSSRAQITIVLGEDYYNLWNQK